VALLGVGTPAATALASLALAAALFHTFNHGLFKSLLFLIAGSLFLRTGTQDLNRMGGWLRRMPWTAGAALVAGLAIAGAPLTNGFASKWCLFVVTFQSGNVLPWLPVLGAIGVLTSALTLAVVVKFFGAAFLGRSPADMNPELRDGSQELPRQQRLAQCIPALLCLVLGLVPAVGLATARLALETSRHGLAVHLADAFPASTGAAGGMAWVGGVAVMTPLLLAALLAAAIGLGMILTRGGGAERRATVPWLCGYTSESVCRYAARDYFGALKPWLSWLSGGRVRGRRSVPAPGPETPAAPAPTMVNRGATLDA
jgi:hydrogenase-4 component B